MGGHFGPSRGRVRG